MNDMPVTIVTGAGSGIGRCVCELLAAQQHRLTLVGRRQDRLEGTLDAIAAAIVDPPEVLVLPADLSDGDQAASVIDLTVDRFQRFDALVNNAGRVEDRPLAETDDQLLHETFALNTFGPARLIARAMPIFARQGGGCVVNVTSIAMVDPFPGLGVYAASKCALDSLTRSLRIEAGDIVRAFTVAPGAVETEMLRGLVSPRDLPPDQTLDPRDVARVIVDCILGHREADQGQAIVIKGKS